MRRIAATVITLALLAGMAMAQDTIRIGVQLELSGRMAVTGKDTLYGMEVALGLQPEVLGLPVDLSVCDTASPVAGAVA